MNNDLLYKDEVYKIIGAAIDVHKELGPGFLESFMKKQWFVNQTKGKSHMKLILKFQFYIKDKN